MTAYFMQESEQEGDDATKKTIDLPATTETTIIDKSAYPKHPAMVLADRIAILSNDSCIVNYTYPTDHPLNKGHFPGNPVMMGVMQWMSISDTLTAFLETQNNTVKHKDAYNCIS
jgi:3-hydroxymyristoyl/3-hydroxydecanoyl-(acyl carrier protein) dehydratase